MLKHTFAGKTITEPIAVTVLQSQAPVVTKDSYNNWTIDISSEDDLLWFANQVNTKNKTDLNANLTEDITVTDEHFPPVGFYRGNSVPYAGIFDGGGHTITMTLDNPGKPAALFYNIGSDGTVCNLVTAGSLTGGTGTADSSVKPGTANNAVAPVAVTLSGGTVSGCENRAAVTAGEKVHAGGIVGDVKGGKVTDCLNSADITGGGYYTGGIAAQTASSAVISGCRNNGHISSGAPQDDENGAAGGIVGTQKSSTVEGSVNTGSVTGSAGTQTGGVIGTVFAGNVSPKLTGCYNTGAVKVTDSTAAAAAGGIAGSVSATGSSMTLKDCFNAGVVTAADTCAGAGALFGTASKLTVKQLANMSGNKALRKTAAKLIGVLSDAVKDSVTETHAAFADSLEDNFAQAGLAEEYAAAEALLPEEDPAPEDPVPVQLSGMTLKYTAAVYTGKELKPAVTVKAKVDGAFVTLKTGSDYTVTYKNNKNVGKASVTVTGTGDYTGTLTKTFSINPKGTTLAKVTAGKKAFTAKWKKQALKMSASVITGYQLQYSTVKTFKSGSKTVTVKGMKKTSKVQKKLKGAKKYYVRIRTYKKVSGVTYYSAWSRYKTVKTKK